VCRRWRRTFLQHATLWSQLYLSGKTDKLLVATLLERVKGSPLDIITSYYGSPVRDVTLLSPFARQIRSLRIKSACSDEVQNLSAAISEPLILLHTLEVDAKGYLNGPRSLAAPTTPLFKTAVNLKKFDLDIGRHPSLRCFTFPNLTTFIFSTWTAHEAFSVSELLDFLEASPTLRQIDMTINADLLHEDVPPGRVIVLPSATTFFLGIINYGPGCEIATHISCPSAVRAKFEHWLDCAGCDVPEDAYPPSVSWSAIVRQYTKGTAERVVLKMAMDEYLTIDCSVAFRSSDRATLEFSYTHHSIEDQDDMDTILNERLPCVFSQASRTIRNHPLLANVRRLWIRGGGLAAGDLELATSDVGLLLGSMGPLREVILDGCDLRPYLNAFLGTPHSPNPTQPASFPPVKKLVITDPVQSFHNDEVSAAAIVELARLQHSRGIPFERMTFNTGVPSLVMKELASFVNTVE